MKENKKFKFPHIHEYLVVITMLLLACFLTYLIPAGEYTREMVGGKETVIADGFHFIEQSPVSPFKMLNMIYQGFVKQANLIFTMFFIAGGVQMLIDTNSVHALMRILATKFAKAPRKTVIVMMIAFGVMSVPIQMNYFIPFSGVVLSLCLLMGYDALTAAAVIITASSFGSTCGMLNISTTAIGNTLAGLPLYHGMGFRWIGFGCMLVITTVCILRYAERVREDGTKSIVYGIPNIADVGSVEDMPEFTTKDGLVLASLAAGVAALIYGCAKLDWSYEETAVCFLVTGIVSQIFGRKNLNNMCISFVAGCKVIIGACIMIGLARSIAIAMDAGNILDTVVYYCAQILNSMPRLLQGPGMFVAHTIINFFVTSGSGQANITMPIFLPVADLIGMSKETAILALNYGDGLSNYIYPHSSSLMAFLAACGVSYGSWMKWMGKTFVVWAAFACLFMMLAVVVGYC
ncbi:TIGR00366 family protein [[Clostridium] symbiosum]|uniref:YfcC family protein n=1 Tax=Clostridium symbiosum TaxID=1512 RepID=UPI001D0642CF|nr:TIGR00366 family protein [[Clostridium] symbiosum]MCB6609174.1 TIGR00366 family protein [[Clostridium] symbiosum]MCB6933101.1 TIGR00366 family protein [[Clostridium] symbiosum]